MDEPKKIPHRVVTVVDLFNILDKYKGLGNYEVACKLLVNERLIILKEDTSDVQSSSLTVNQ